MMAHIGEDLSEEKIENLLAALDPSGDGAVDFDEFKQFINRGQVGISQSREFCGTMTLLSRTSQQTRDRKKSPVIGATRSAV